ncbi:HAMP domain-containing sensor histidine kinase [Roseateles sp.]|uniref:sensor histidine kinase n=1 Tax=Roseateles sp. TaxID=1971397 RepID=UPI0032675B7D
MTLDWLRPTLTRRLIGALLIAFTLCSVLILVQDQLDIQDTLAADPGVRQLGRQLAAGLAEIDDAALAARVLDGHMRYINRLRAGQRMTQGPLLAQLTDREGRAVYSTAPAATLDKAGVGEQPIAGRMYWTYRQDDARWSLRLAEPSLSRASLLSFASQQLGLQLLVAFPLMLLPLWLAVYSGLAPLRRFARRLNLLDLRQDLAPLGMDLRYTELRPVGDAFDALLQRLRQRRARERAFVHEAAHELRTPLAVVATQAHALVQAGDTAARETAAAALQQAIARSAHLSRQLLDLASLDNEQAAVAVDLDLAHFCAQRLAEQAPVARERGIALALDAPEQLPVRLDAVALHSVLQNLLDNALRYVARGARVEVGLQATPNGVQLSVADDGPGIAAAERSLAFERFWRGAGHDLPGSGLGLAIVARAAERLGGQVTITDGLARPGGCGVRFELRLPGTVLGVS